MAQETERVEIVRRLFEARRAGSAPGMGPHASDLYTEDTELYVPFGLDSGLYSGLDEVARFWRRYFEAWGPIENEIEHMLEHGDCVHVQWRAGASSASGMRVPEGSRGSVTYFFRGSRVARTVFYMDWMAAD